MKIISDNIIMYKIILCMVILITIWWLDNMNEGFYNYFTPSNCMNNVFGNTLCYRSYIFPFLLIDNWHLRI